MKVRISEQIKDFFFKPAFVYRLEDMKNDFKWKYQRFKRGYADVDQWNINDWFVRTIIPMLHGMSNNHAGHPMELTDKQWMSILNKMANCFEEYYDDTKCKKKNKYEEEYNRISDEFRVKYGRFGEALRTEEDKNEEITKGLYRIYTPSDALEYKKISEKYFNECRKIEAYKQKKLNEGLELFVKYFNDLWD